MYSKIVMYIVSMDFCLGITLHRHLIDGNYARLGSSGDINGYFLMIICTFCYMYFTSFKITYLKLHFGKVKQQECHMVVSPSTFNLSKTGGLWISVFGQIAFIYTNFNWWRHFLKLSTWCGCHSPPHYATHRFNYWSHISSDLEQKRNLKLSLRGNS